MERLPIGLFCFTNLNQSGGILRGLYLVEEGYRHFDSVLNQLLFQLHLHGFGKDNNLCETASAYNPSSLSSFQMHGQWKLPKKRSFSIPEKEKLSQQVKERNVSPHYFYSLVEELAEEAYQRRMAAAQGDLVHARINPDAPPSIQPPSFFMNQPGTSLQNEPKRQKTK